MRDCTTTPSYAATQVSRVAMECNAAGCGARDQARARNHLHLTTKPVALIERTVRNSSKTKDIVLDCFAGSGSTLSACAKAGRQARLIELDPRYCDVIIRRFQDWTGEQATLQGDGRSLEEIAAQRSDASLTAA